MSVILRKCLLFTTSMCLVFVMESDRAPEAIGADYSSATSGTPIPGRLSPGTWYMRIVNPTDASGDLCARVYFNLVNQSIYVSAGAPTEGDTIYIANGGKHAVIPAKDHWLKPGEHSDWIDISTHLPTTIAHAFSLATDSLRPVFIGAINEPSSTHMRMLVELARGMNKIPVRSIPICDDHPNYLGYLAWLNGTPKLPTLGLLVSSGSAIDQRILTFEEAAYQQLEWIKSCGETPKQCRYLWFISYQNIVGGDHDTPSFKNPTLLEKMQTEIVFRLGYNNLTHYAKDREDIQAIKALTGDAVRARILHYHILNKLISSEPNRYKQPRDFTDELKKTADYLKSVGIWKYVRAVSFGDEIDAWCSFASSQERDEKFRTYLKSKSFKPWDFVRPDEEQKAVAKPEKDQWQFVHLDGVLPASKPKLLYEAATYRYRLWTDEFAQCTKGVQQHFPKGTLTGSNVFPHTSNWPDVRKFIDMFRLGGLSMPWSEDWWWMKKDVSPQTEGFVMAALRRAAQYHNSDICYYTIPEQITKAPQISANNFLRMNYFALGNQVKAINHFTIYHQGAANVDHIDFDQSQYTYKAIHRITSDAARIDERLYRAQMRPADVAILLSIANDVWNNEDLLSDPKEPRNINGPIADQLQQSTMNVDNHERKCLWLALRHSNIPVDLITDEDAANGKLKRYKVLFLVGQELLRNAAPAINNWVQDGGVLISSGGGGILDEYRVRIDSMYDLYGLKSTELQRPTRGIDIQSDLPGIKPLDEMKLNGIALPVLCYKQSIIPTPSARIIGTYQDSTPAAIIKQHGKGKAILIGGLPGLAYVRPAMIKLENYPEMITEDYSQPIGALIRSLAETRYIKKHILTSDPLVDATLQDGPLGSVVTLTRFRNQPQGELTIILPGCLNAQKIVSLRHGNLAITRTKQGPSVHLSIDQGDFLLVD